MRRVLLAIGLSVLVGMPASTGGAHAARAAATTPLAARTFHLADAASWRQLPPGLAQAMHRTMSVAPARIAVPAPPQARLAAPSSFLFGYSVAFSGAGTIALIGADDAAYVFVRSGSTWVQQAHLTAPSSFRFGYLGYFGSSVALDLAGTTALIGAPGETVGQSVYAGAAYLFVRSGSTWVEQAHLTVPSSGSYSDFGYSVALDLAGTTALIGAPVEGGDNGAAYVFT